eukprot:3999400-Prymnesium_polylepis.1
MRLRSSSAAHGGDVAAGCEHGSKDKEPALVKMWPPAQRLAAGARLAAGGAIFKAKDPGAIGDASERAGVSTSSAE